MSRCHTLPSEHDDTAFTQLVIFFSFFFRADCYAILNLKTIVLCVKSYYTNILVWWMSTCVNVIDVTREIEEA